MVSTKEQQYCGYKQKAGSEEKAGAEWDQPVLPAARADLALNVSIAL